MKYPEKYRKPFVSHIYNIPLDFFLIPFMGRELKVIATPMKGFEHVSVSLPNRNPNWDEMCFVKDLFWDDEEIVFQLHPRKSQYVNLHQHCLHLWKANDIIVNELDKLMENT